MGLAATVFTAKSTTSEPVERSPFAMVAVSGEQFDPLELAQGRPEPQRSGLQDLPVAHGKLALAAVLCTGGYLLAAAPALADGIDFGFNYDFDVEFEGLEIDHRILVDLIVTGQAIGFIGALIGGVSARQRKEEVEKLASKLTLVNRQLRQQARLQKEGLYTPVELSECDEEQCEIERGMIVELLREGKAALREGNADHALKRFRRSLEILKESKDFEDPKSAERKAWRGIGGAYVMLGKPTEALEAMTTVLRLTKEIGDQTGLCDAYGVIADIYTELNQLSKAAFYYDLYIDTLTKDGYSDAV